MDEQRDVRAVRTIWTKEFKLGAVRLSEEKGTRVAAKELGIPEQRICKWRRQVREKGELAFSRKPVEIMERRGYREPELEKGWPDELRDMMRVQRTEEGQDETQGQRFWRKYLVEHPKEFVSRMLELKASVQKAGEKKADEAIREDVGYERGREALLEALRVLEGGV